MDCLLRLAKLEADPNAPDSKQVFKHWRKTFERFVAAVENGRDVNDLEIDKYGLLINHVSSSVYNYNEETNNYGQAVILLERAYIKPRNKIVILFTVNANSTAWGKYQRISRRQRLRSCKCSDAQAKHESRCIY